MIIIADSGSTKTDWLVIDNDKIVNYKTVGINPFYQDSNDITKIISECKELSELKPESIFFYGAGCAFEDKNNIVKEGIKSIIDCDHIEIASDLLAAARSMFGRNSGIACIMGTGSNSCFYNGKEIIHNVSPLGFMLGDEGSGAVIGKQLTSDCLKNQAPADIIKKFFEYTKSDAGTILNRVYKQPFPNRYLASLTKFIKANISDAYLHNMVKKCFIDFFVRNIYQYQDYSNQSIMFTGSIAYHFSDILSEAAKECNLSINNITESPLEGLKNYHLNNF